MIGLILAIFIICLFAGLIVYAAKALTDACIK